MHSYQAALIFLTGTPSNRTSRARADLVAGWRVTMSYNELLICNPGCNPVCNTGGPGRCRQRSRDHQDRPSTQTDWRPTCRANIERSIGSLVELTLNVQCSDIERTIFSLTNWSLTLNIYNKYIHRQFSHEQYILIQSFITESGYWEQKLCLNTGNE